MKRYALVYCKVGLQWGWYIWDFVWHDILEGEDCGPFYDEITALDAIGKINL